MIRKKLFEHCFCQIIIDIVTIQIANLDGKFSIWGETIEF
jgi:hypothetical protein